MFSHITVPINWRFNSLCLKMRWDGSDLYSKGILIRQFFYSKDNVFSLFAFKDFRIINSIKKWCVHFLSICRFGLHTVMARGLSRKVQLANYTPTRCFAPIFARIGLENKFSKSTDVTKNKKYTLVE